METNKKTGKPNQSIKKKSIKPQKGAYKKQKECIQHTKIMDKVGEKHKAQTKEKFCIKDKIDNSCPYAKKCGGCDYQGIEYQKQLEMKEANVRKLLKEFVKVSPIVGMDDPYHYRHKVHSVFGCAGRGHVVAGVYKKNSHDIVDIESCQIEDQEADAIIREVKSLLKSFKIKVYDEDTGYGLLRHVLIRKGYHTGEIMVVLVLASPILPSKNNFVKALRKNHPNISTVVINVNEKKTSMVLGERNIVVYGKGFIEDKLCGCIFRISPNSFYQVNPKQTEFLYEKAIACAKLTGKERVIDAYCGTGTIGIIASKYAKEVLGVELNKDAIKDAITNAKRNEIKNIRFVNDDAGKYMVSLAERIQVRQSGLGRDSRRACTTEYTCVSLPSASGFILEGDCDFKDEQVDVVIMDPPRSGSDEAFLSSVVRLAPKRVVYISCGPDTLARDLKYLVKKGYRVEEATPYDMFPFTEHTEVIVALSKKF